MRALLAVLLLACWPAAATAVSAIPGGLIEFDLGQAIESPPAVYFGNRRVLTSAHDGRWTAWIGVDLDTPPGDYVVRIERDEETVEHRVVTITPRRHLATAGASPDDSLTRAMLAAATRIPDDAWREPLDAELPLTYPLASPYTNHFGVRVLESEQVSHWRYAIGFEAPGDAALVAPGGGIAYRKAVRASGAENICIDHGMGLVSCVAPVFDVQVEDGATVARGQPLGVSGIDLDGGPTVVNWLVRLNGVQVDPERFLPRPPSGYSNP